jgi:hypothetical protein
MRRAVLFLLLASCAQRGELLVSSDATLIVESDHIEEIPVKAGRPARFVIPAHSNYTVHVRSPGHASISALMGGADCKESYYSPTSNSSCKSKDDDGRRRGEHPFAWLRGPAGAPFDLPAPGQGFVVTTDSPNVKVYIDNRPPTPYVDRPLVLPLSVGHHALVAEDGAHTPFQEDVEIVANTYRFVHVQIGGRTPGVGGSWNR